MHRDETETSAADERLVEVITSYLEAEGAGAGPDRQELLNRHPDLVPELTHFFVAQDRIRELVAPLRQVARAATVGIGDTDDTPHGSQTARPDSRLAATLDSLGYEFQGEIGQGGSGVVYKVRQHRPDRLVALKTIATDRQVSPEDVGRFRNETETLGSLSHPNIVPVYEVREHEHQLFLCMKLMEAGSLDRHLGRFHDNPRAAACLLVSIANAVHYAHQHGVLHRDLKPSNILLDGEGQPHVTDFGLAKRVDTDTSLTRSGAIVGTPRYMAPEQVSGRRAAATTATDVYGLGAILYALLTGKPPFQSDTVLETLQQVQTREPDRPRAINPRVDRDLETICLKCLEKEPRQRYGSAQALAEELERCLRGEPIQARPLGRAQRFGRWCRRNPRAAGLTGAVVVLLVVILTALAIGTLLIARERDATLERERALRQLLYVQNVHLAHQAWQAGDYRRMRELLERDKSTATGEDLRGFEWHYLDALLRSAPRELACVQGHEGDTYCVTWSPDGRTLVSCGLDGFVRLWDPETLQRRAAWRAHEDEVNIVLFSPDGRGLATASDDGSIRLWALPEPTLLARLEGHGDWVESMAYSPDGKSLAASGRDGVVRLWDVAAAQCRERLDLEAGLIHMLMFSPDGQTLAAATARGGGVLLNVGPLRRRTAVNAAEEVRSVTFSPDGRTLALGLSWKGEIHLVEAAGNRDLHVLRGHQSSVRLASFSPDGSLLASCGDDGKLRVWDARTGRLRSAVDVANDRVWCATWSPDGKRVATADRNGAVKVYDMTVPPAQLTFHFAAPALPGFVFFRDTATLRAGLYDNRIWELDLPSLRPKEGAPAPYIWSASGDRTLLGWHWSDCQVEVRDADRQASWRTDCHGHVAALDRSPDGRQLVMSLRPAPDCHHLAAGDSAQPPGVWLWDLATGMKHNLGRTDGICHHAAFSPDGRSLAVADGPRVRVIDVATRKVRFLEGHGKEVSCFAFSSDGQLLATGSADHTICVWELDTGQARNRFFRPLTEVRTLCFSPDRKTLAGGDATGKVVLWHVATGQELMTLDEYSGPVTSVAFSPDGRVLATSVLTADLKYGEVILLYGAGGGPARPLR
jgi:WD40 repeat protein/tRNA A-37 threonylcarbamoyl transferase component Bud32